MGVEAELAGDGPHETSPESASGPLHPGTDAPSLVALLEMALDPEAWEAFSRGSAIRGAGRAGFARNVCVGLGNWLGTADDPDPVAIRLLERALSDPASLVRGHAAWALGQVGLGEAWEVLGSSLELEGDPWVREEIGSALGR